MLAIRMQRTGRKGHANYRVVVQDSRQTPTSGKVVAMLGSYDPHTKVAVITKDRLEHFLNHGAQPSERVVKLLQKEGVKLPKWVKTPQQHAGKIRNLEKLRKNRPAGAEAPAKPETETKAETEAVEGETTEPKAENTETAAEQTDSAEEPKAEEPAEAEKAETEPTAETKSADDK